jgi:hypothetical protein
MGREGRFYVSGKENFFVFPECDAEHAFPGHKPGEPLMWTKCDIP